MEQVLKDICKIKPYRLKAIDKAVQVFRADFKTGPFNVDCIKIARSINKNCERHNIRFQSSNELDSNNLAKTIYIKKFNQYYIIINRSQFVDTDTGRLKYPFKKSSDRIVNFTIAHEFGHIYLDHAQIPDIFKTTEILMEEDLEANEFAGRLLMPEIVLKKCRFNSISEAAKLFHVSMSALSRRIESLEIDKSSLFLNQTSCPICGNNITSSISKNCSICGNSTQNENGVYAMNYDDGYWIDLNGRLINCPNCGFSDFEDHDRRCPRCKHILHNQCINGNCNKGIIIDPSARYCRHCGSSTTFSICGDLKPWKPARDALLCLEAFIESRVKDKDASSVSLNNWFNFVILLDLKGLTVASSLSHSNAYISNDHLFIVFKKLYDKHRFEYGNSNYEVTLKHFIHYFGHNAKEIHSVSFEEFLPAILRD